MADTTVQKRKDDARELALLLYDIFSELDHENGKMDTGQNNANQSNDE